MAEVVIPSTRTFRYWNESEWWGDQGDTPECVAFSSLHWLADGPVTHEVHPYQDPTSFFAAIDGGPDGAVIRDAFKWMQALAVVGSYHWALNLEELRNCILETGPFVIGIPWFEGFDNPDSHGLVQPTGNIRGGHALEVNGYNKNHGLWRIKNSWGRTWGDEGRLWMTDQTLEYVVFGADGEAVVGTELKPAKPKGKGGTVIEE
jgi:hypothetical protein